MRISDWSSDVCSSDLQRGDRLDLLGVCAEAARVSDEIDLGQHLVTRVGEQIVEGGAAGRGLKAVNATEATIVEQHEDQFDAHRNRGGQLRIEPQIAAVAMIGREHVCTPVTNAQLVCRLLVEKKKMPKTSTAGST